MTRWFVARALFYPTLAWNLLLHWLVGRRRWWDRVHSHVLLGAMPFAHDVKELREEGVKAVVNLCEEYGGPRDAYEQAGIVQLHLPTVDFTVPSRRDIGVAVRFITEHVERGEAVYTHCKAGRGRSATVVLCWLMCREGMTPEQAQDHLLTCRPHVNRHLCKRTVVQALSADTER